MCGGTIRPSTEGLEEWHGDSLYVFEHVPVQVCDRCGEIFIAGVIAEKMDELVEKTKPTCTIEAPVYDLRLPKCLNSHRPEAEGNGLSDLAASTNPIQGSIRRSIA